MQSYNYEPLQQQKKILTIPNILSFFRICLIPVIAWLYCTKEAYVLTGCVVILSGVTDVLDGYIARHYHMVSDLGKALDPIADKMTQAVVLICLIIRYPLILIPFALFVLKELFMGITGLLVIHNAEVMPSANWHGKAATVLLYLMMVLHIFWGNIPTLCSALLIAICTIMIAISFVLYGIKNIKTLCSARQKSRETDEREV